jgi:serine/threonine protein kinase
VAVKVIELRNHSDELHAHFLEDEISVLELIRNSETAYLLKLEKVIKSKNNMYIVTEFCEGGDVAKLLRKKKLFNEAEAQSIMKQLLRGYRELYNLKLVHRDLKLANLFLSRGKVKIADFGFAVPEEQCN